MRNFKKFAAVFLALIILTVFNVNSFAADAQTTADSEYLQSARDFINKEFSGNIDTDALNKADTLPELFKALDDYSAYYTPEEYNALMQMFQGSLEGVGIEVNPENDEYVTILNVFDGSPAQKAGVLTGDKIAEVNGESVKGQTTDAVISKIKGPAGTTVKLGIIRQGVKNIMAFEMARAEITIPSVHYEIRGNIGYILIDQFTETTYSGVDAALRLFDNKKITRVVLDLRNNPGGLVDQAVQVARCFVPKGLITKLDYKDEAIPDQSYYSELSAPKYKLAVLVNENSASASEILTGAIKDTGAGTIVGNKTFGKAKVQGFFPILTSEAYKTFNKDQEIKSVNALDFYNAMLSDVAGWGKMTIGLYYTPKGECIDLKGIEPDEKVLEDIPEDSVPVELLKPTSVTVKPNLETEYMDVLYAEWILKFLKYDVDEPDFKLDQKTFAAIKKFQKDSKVYSYGVLDYTTQKLLNAKLSELKQTQDPVYVKAVSLVK